MKGLRLLSVMLVFWLSLGMMSAAQAGSFFGSSQPAFLTAEEAFKPQLITQPDGTVAISWTIAPGYYLYRKRMSIVGRGGEIDVAVWPQGTMVHDETFGDSEVYFNQVDLPLVNHGATALVVGWQGCAEAGLCYPPQSMTMPLQMAAAGSSASVSAHDLADKSAVVQTDDMHKPAQSSTSGSVLAEDQQLVHQLRQAGLLWNLVVFFGLGLLLSLTPCVLPMVPILLAVIVGNGAGRARAFRLSLAFVVSMAVTYAVLGVVAALAGANLQSTLQTPWFIVPLALIFVLLALSMFGLYELQLPSVVRERLNAWNQQQSGGSVLGAGMMGFFSALLASPCMTAPLAGALIYIADTGDTVLGGLALLTLGLGMGAPMVLLGTLGGGLLPKPGGWMTVVKAVFGFILLAMAVWFLARVLPATVVLALWGALLVVLALNLWMLMSSSSVFKQIVQSVSVVLGLWGALMMIGGAMGGTRLMQPLSPLVAPSVSSVVISQNDRRHAAGFVDFKTLAELEQVLTQAQAVGQWTLVDFYADWCTSCKVIEKEVFQNAQVVDALSSLQLLRVDVTANDASDQALMKKLQVIGPPTVLLIGPNGQERRAQRVIGEISAEAFLARLTQAQAAP